VDVAKSRPENQGKIPNSQNRVSGFLGKSDHFFGVKKCGHSILSVGCVSVRVLAGCLSCACRLPSIRRNDFEVSQFSILTCDMGTKTSLLTALPVAA
jgi:hypothetical protein